jgi:hypothetical protein
MSDYALKWEMVQEIVTYVRLTSKILLLYMKMELIQNLREWEWEI